MTSLAKPTLTPKQQRFVQEFLIDANATNAAMKAGYSERTAAKQGWQLLENPRVAAAIAEAQARAANRNEVAVDQIIGGFLNIAFTDVDEVLPWTEDGPRLIPSDQLPQRVKAAISSIKFKRRRETNGNNEWLVEDVEVKMLNKQNALDSLAKIRGLFIDRHEHKVEGYGTFTLELGRGEDE